MEPRSVKPLTLIKLKTLSTQRLLAYLKKLQRCEVDFESSDLERNELDDTIIFKNSREWETQYSLVKTVLAERPHSSL